MYQSPKFLEYLQLILFKRKNSSSPAAFCLISLRFHSKKEENEKKSFMDDEEIFILQTKWEFCFQLKGIFPIILFEKVSSGISNGTVCL